MDESHIRWLERREYWQSHFAPQIRRAQPPRPGVLYHYTTTTGFQGILRTGLLRAGHFRYCNDPFELRYAAEVAREFIAERHVDSEIVSAALRGLANSLEQQPQEDTFVICFSELDDDLNQWRPYAADGLGYAIGFATDGWQLPPEWGLYKIAYERHEQWELLDSWVSSTSKLEEQLPARMDDEEEYEIAREALSYVVSDLFWTASLHFKAPSYRSEREWRLAYVRDRWAERLPISFTENRRGLAPFVELPLRRADAERLPITSVVIGPRHVAFRSLRTIDLFLRSHQFYPELEDSPQEPVLDRADQYDRAMFDPVNVRMSKIRYDGV